MDTFRTLASSPDWSVSFPRRGNLKTESELVAASDLNFAGSYRKLAQHCPRGEIHSEGAVMAFVTGVPLSIFNGCLVLEESTAFDLAAASNWVTSKAVPYHVWINEGINPQQERSGTRRFREGCLDPSGNGNGA